MKGSNEFGRSFVGIAFRALNADVYDTVYVRLSSGGDPDAQDADHVQFRQIPQATEHVFVPSTAGDITSNLDQSAVAIGSFIRERGHEGTIGVDATSTTPVQYLRIDPDYFEHDGNGQAWIDLHSAAISPHIYGTFSPGEGIRGLYLRGTALEYLEGVLPPEIRERLWPFLEDTRPRTRPVRARTEILADLLRSNESIVMNLEQLKRAAGGPSQGPPAQTTKRWQTT